VLTTRQYEILTYVLQSSDFVTMSSIAARFRLSTRTVQRELDTIAGYLEGDRALVEKKTGYGVRFCGDESDRMRLLTGIRGLTRLRPVYSQSERVFAVLLALLTSNEPRKIYTFTRELGVTETTVGQDLNFCEKWLKENGVELVRRPGVGVYVQADEWQRRQAMVHLYYNIQSEDSGAQYERLPNALDVRRLFDPDKIAQIDQLLDHVRLLDGMIQNDRSRGAIVVHLYMILLRVCQGAGISTDTGAERDDKAEALAQALIGALEERFLVRIPSGERAYLASLLRTAKGLGGISDEEAERQASRIAERIIRMAEARTGAMIDPGGGFTEALKKHLIPTLARLSMGMDIRNPILDDVKLHYQELYQLAKDCAVIIEEELVLRVPDSELGYLAVHLGVALEDSRSYFSRRCRAVVCCPSGMVTAQLLALRVNREFPDIETADVVSTSNLDFEQMEQSNIEMIISTVPLSCKTIPCVQVSPFLTDAEKDAVWQVLKRCKSEPHPQQEHASLTDLVTTLARTRNVIDTILEVLSNLFVEPDADYESMPSVIDSIALRAAAKESLIETVRIDLIEREKFGSTVTADQRTMLLHCRTEGVDRVWFGVIRPHALSYRSHGEVIQPRAILVMLAPKTASRQTLGTLGSLSREIVESDAFLETLHTGDLRRCYLAVERVLNAYYFEISRQ
jgi:mannitol operon transcriptional antiterminator